MCCGRLSRTRVSAGGNLSPTSFIIPLLYPKTLTDARTFATIYQFSLEPRGQQELTCGQDGNTEACGRAVAGGRGWKVCVRPELFLRSLQGSFSKLSKC